MLGFALTALHEDAADIFPCLVVFFRIFRGEVEVFHRHAEIFADAVEAQIHIALCEAHGEVHIGSFAVNDPFIHAEEVAVLEVQVHGIDHLGNDGELFGGTDGTADAAGAFGSRLHPCRDVFQRFCRIEFLNGVVDIDLKTGALVIFERVNGDLCRFIEDAAVECGVVPPCRCQFAECSHFFSP